MYRNGRRFLRKGFDLLYSLVVLDIISFISRISFQKFLLKWKSKTDSAASDESTQRALISTKRRTYNLDTQCHRPFSCKKIYLKEYLCFACPQALSSSLRFWKSLDSRSFDKKKQPSSHVLVMQLVFN